jgi:hypothetical protein
VLTWKKKTGQCLEDQKSELFTKHFVQQSKCLIKSGWTQVSKETALGGAEQPTCLVLFQGVGDGGASQGSKCRWWGSSVPRESTQKHLIDAFSRLALFSHENGAFLKRAGYKYPIFNLMFKEKQALKCYLLHLLSKFLLDHYYCDLVASKHFQNCIPQLLCALQRLPQAKQGYAEFERCCFS